MNDNTTKDKSTVDKTDVKYQKEVKRDFDRFQKETDRNQRVVKEESEDSGLQWQEDIVDIVEEDEVEGVDADSKIPEGEDYKYGL